jgi:dienelactone hydrolase
MTKQWIIAAITLLWTGVGSAHAQVKISIPSVTPAGLAALLRHEALATSVSGDLYLPPGASGPLPALVLMHGSGGLQGPTGSNIRKWAGTFAGWGIASLVVDSFGPRGLTSTAADQSKLSSWADVEDALAALQVLGADARIDRKRIGVIGWSRGGTAAFNSALETVRKNMIKDDLKFALHVAFYGPAQIQYRDRATDQSPVMILHGEADNYVPIGPVHEFADWLQSRGNSVTFISYPKIYHDFDVQGGPQGFEKAVETGIKCDLVIDVSTGRVIRMNHADAPKANADDVRAYIKSCVGHGANLAFNAATRADAVEKLHAFLKQYFQIAQ